jgi:hypothetical protein
MPHISGLIFFVDCATRLREAAERWLDTADLLANGNFLTCIVAVGKTSV